MILFGLVLIFHILPIISTYYFLSLGAPPCLRYPNYFLSDIIYTVWMSLTTSEAGKTDRQTVRRDHHGQVIHLDLLFTLHYKIHIFPRFATVWFGSSRLTVAGSFTFPFLPNRSVGRERMVRKVNDKARTRPFRKGYLHPWSLGTTEDLVTCLPVPPLPAASPSYRSLLSLIPSLAQRPAFGDEVEPRMTEAGRRDTMDLPLSFIHFLSQYSLRFCLLDPKDKKEEEKATVRSGMAITKPGILEAQSPVFYPFHIPLFLNPLTRPKTQEECRRKEE